MGQRLSTMQGFIPEPYCTTFQALQDQVPSISYNEVNILFQSEFGKDIHEIFDEFEEVPIAAASIGQVHKGKIDGITYAIKVQYPHVKYFFRGDLSTSMRILDIIERLRNNKVSGVSKYMKESFEKELNFLIEAE